MSSLEKYLKNRKEIELYSITLSCLIIGILFRVGKLFLISEKISQTISLVLISVSYLLLLKISSILKKRDIHGIRAFVWAAFLLYFALQRSSEEIPLWLSILNTITIFVLMFFFIDGFLRFVFSLVNKIRNMDSSENNTMESIEAVIAILTSIVAIIISIIAL